MLGFAKLAEVREAESLAELAVRINSAHEAGEHSCQKGIEYFRAAGEALLKAKSKCGHGRWLGWLETNIKCTERQARRYMALAQTDVTSDLEGAWRVILGNDDKMAHVGRATGEHEWYTPREYIEAAEKVLGAIDLDPASSDAAQKVIKAKQYFTKGDDGLTKEWTGRVWLNPPYNLNLIGKFTAKLRQHYQDGDITSALLLVNNATETTWFQEVARHASSICLLAGRIRFLDEEGNAVGAPLQGQAILYFGRDVNSFERELGNFGLCFRQAGPGHKPIPRPVT
jgi:phage N-6-adenine-methyltransferase